MNGNGNGGGDCGSGGGGGGGCGGSDYGRGEGADDGISGGVACSGGDDDSRRSGDDDSRRIGEIIAPTERGSKSYYVERRKTIDVEFDLNDATWNKKGETKTGGKRGDIGRCRSQSKEADTFTGVDAVPEDATEKQQWRQLRGKNLF